MMAIACVGIALFIAGMALSTVTPWLALLGLAGFAVGFLANAYGWAFAFRCLVCRVSWGYLAMHSGAFFIDKKIRYCPFCGTDVDVEIETVQSQEAADF